MVIQVNTVNKEIVKSIWNVFIVFLNTVNKEFKTNILNMFISILKSTFISYHNLKCHIAVFDQSRCCILSKIHITQSLVTSPKSNKVLWPLRTTYYTVLGDLSKIHIGLVASQKYIIRSPWWLVWIPCRSCCLSKMHITQSLVTCPNPSMSILWSLKNAHYTVLGDLSKILVCQSCGLSKMHITQFLVTCQKSK